MLPFSGAMPTSKSKSSKGKAAGKDDNAAMMQAALGVRLPLHKVKRGGKPLVRKDWKAQQEAANAAIRAKRRGKAARLRRQREAEAAKWQADNDAAINAAARELMRKANEEEAEEAARRAKEEDERTKVALVEEKLARLAAHKDVDDKRRSVRARTRGARLARQSSHTMKIHLDCCCLRLPVCLADGMERNSMDGA